MSQKKDQPKNWHSETPVVSPPSSSTVAGEQRVVLYDHAGRPLVRAIGFKPKKGKP